MVRELAKHHLSRARRDGHGLNDPGLGQVLSYGIAFPARQSQAKVSRDRRREGPGGHVRQEAQLLTRYLA